MIPGSRVWPTGPARPHLGRREVHVWRSRLDLSPGIRTRLAVVLDEQEQQRAARFATEELRHRYVVGRGILRHLLAAYVDLEAAAIRFRYGEHDKPFLAADAAGSGVSFNLSHSRHLALFAFSRDREIGIDVESIRNDLQKTEIATRFFSPRESSQLRSLPAGEQSEYFFALWTCKEAFVKAQGGGISFGLDRFDVQLEPGGEPAVIVANRRDEDFSPWFAYRLDPGSGFAAAVAVDERDLRISAWDWPAES